MPLQSHTQTPDLIERLLLQDRALAATAEGITIADALAKDRPLIYVNEGFERMTGYSIAETLGLNCRFLQGVDTSREAVREISEAISQERQCDVELINYRKDGTPFWNRLSITPVRDGMGRTTHFIGVQSDVTRRRLAEQELHTAIASLQQINQKMGDDLRAAAAIQQALLPTNIPTLEGTNIEWAFLPCDELGGDILDVLTIDDRRIAFYLLDVCGHGVAAALLSTTLSRWLSRMPAELRMDPLAVVNNLNDAFQMSEVSSQFFTCCYAVLNLNEQNVSFVSAGHPPPILVRQDTVREISVPGFPVGVVRQPEYELQKVQLLPGDRFYLYSDGAVEQMAATGEMFGGKQLMRKLLDDRTAPLRNSIDLSFGAVMNSALNVETLDDISMLGVELLPLPKP